MDGIVPQKLVGIREKVALALQKAVGGVGIVREVLPEGVLAEIALAGLLQKVGGAAQARVLHLLGDGLGRGALREGEPHAVGLGVNGQGGNEVLVAAAGGKGKLAVLQLACRALFADVPAEQVRGADHTRVLQSLGNACHAAALPDAHAHRLTGGLAAVDLAFGGKCCTARREGQQNDPCQQNFQCAALFAGGAVGIFVCHTHSFSHFPSSAADSSRSHQRARPQSGSCRSPAGHPRPKRGSGPRPR